MIVLLFQDFDHYHKRMKKYIQYLLAFSLVFIFNASPVAANTCDIPYLYENVKTTGILNYKVIFVKYTDSPEYLKGSPKSFYNKADFKEAEQYFKTSSGGKAKLKFDPVMQWFTLPKTFSSYSVLGFDPDWKQKEDSFVLDAFAIVDPLVDFSGSDGVIFVSDTSKGRKVLAYNLFVNMDGRKLGSVAFNEGGAYQLAHEVLHNFGLRDLYRHGGFTLRGLQNHPVKHYSIMGQYFNGANPLAYEKYLLKWLPQKSTTCHAGGTRTYKMTALDKKSGTQLIVVPISQSEVLTVEYRRGQGVDKYLDAEGIFISHINSDIFGGQLPIKLLNKSKPIKKGKFSFQGINIEVNGTTVTLKS